MSGDTIRELAALGLSIEQVAGVLDIMEREAEARKEKARARLHKHREKKRGETLRSVASELAGSDARGEDNLQTKNISGQEEKKDISPPARSKRGERIPEDFSPDIEAAVSEGLSRPEAERQARNFCDYWRAKPGKDGLKLDWQATWRVWYRRNLSRPPSQRTSDPPQRGVMGAARRILESEGNGSESIFGNLGDGELLPPAGSAGQRDASADIPSPFAGLRLVGHS